MEIENVTYFTQNKYNQEGCLITRNRNAVPVWKKYCLTIPEAAMYFGIGEKKLRSLMDWNLDDGFVLQNGSKRLIKRVIFEDFLDNTDTIQNTEWKGQADYDIIENIV